MLVDTFGVDIPEPSTPAAVTVPIEPSTQLEITTTPARRFPERNRRQPRRLDPSQCERGRYRSFYLNNE